MKNFKTFMHRAYNFIDRRLFYNFSRLRKSEESLFNYYVQIGIPNALQFNFQELKSRTLAFLSTMKTGTHLAEFKFSSSTNSPNIYCSAYACITLALYGELMQYSNEQKLKWLDYFNSFQSDIDGLFRDPTIKNELFETEDWWGARHLAPHLIIAFNQLGGTPKHDFYFLEPFYSPKYVNEWLDSRDWAQRCDFVGNEVMNYGVLLQYSRDFFDNKSAGIGLMAMLKWLVNNIDPNSGLWGGGPLDEPDSLSKAVQGAYHIYPLLFYDGLQIPYPKPLIDNLLRTQNKLGGYGVLLNSSACEDIDSIDLLIRLTRLTDYKRDEIVQSLWKALPWILANMNEDGGFVFRRGEGLVYGHLEMSSEPNESAMFPTWFRTLTIAYLINFLQSPHYKIGRTPGYQF